MPYWEDERHYIPDSWNKRYHAIGHCTRLPNVACPHCQRETVCNHDGLDIQFCFSCYKRADTGKWYALDCLTYYFKQDKKYHPIGYVMVDGTYERVREIVPSTGVYDKHDFEITTHSGKRAFAYDGTVIRVGAIG